MLHKSEWLDQAQKVPVGQKRRVFHGAEPSAAMDVYNHETYWSCYCHRCKESGKVYKAVAEKAVAAPVFRKYLNMGHLIDLTTVSRLHPKIFSTIIKLLHDKGVSLSMIAEFKPKYNTVDQRLVFCMGTHDVGRDITGTSPAKWLVYHRDNGYGTLHLQPKIVDSPYLVITEDLFSAIKIRKYTGLGAMVLLGTGFNDDKLSFITKGGYKPILALDGDSAGYSARNLIIRRFELFGIDYRVAAIPDGYDPKDLNSYQIQDIFKC